jgi:hypothetical protein
MSSTIRCSIRQARSPPVPLNLHIAFVQKPVAERSQCEARRIARAVEHAHSLGMNEANRRSPVRPGRRIVRGRASIDRRIEVRSAVEVRVGSAVEGVSVADGAPRPGRAPCCTQGRSQ